MINIIILLKIGLLRLSRDGLGEVHAKADFFLIFRVTSYQRMPLDWNKEFVAIL